MILAKCDVCHASKEIRFSILPELWLRVSLTMTVAKNGKEQKLKLGETSNDHFVDICPSCSEKSENPLATVHAGIVKNFGGTVNAE